MGHEDVLDIGNDKLVVGWNLKITQGIISGFEASTSKRAQVWIIVNWMTTPSCN
jgi:hypothetical protein